VGTVSAQVFVDPVPVAVEGNIVCGSNVTGNTNGATHSFGNTAPEHWWRFTAPVTGVYTFNTCGSNYNTWVHIFNRVGSGNRTTLAATCNDCGPCGSRTVLTTTLTVGNYLVGIDGFRSENGVYQMQVSCPGNITRQAEGNISCGQTRTGNTQGSNSSIGHAAPEEYWMITLAQGGPITISSCGSAFDTFVSLYSHTQSGGLLGSLVSTCDDCGPCGTRTILDVNYVPAGTYVIVMDGFSSSAGAYRLSVDCTAPPPPPSSGALSCNGNVTGTTVGAGPSTVGHRAPERWYTFTATARGYYTFNSCGSSFDTYIHVFRRGANNLLANAVTACDDCGPCGTRTVLTVLLAAGDYWIAIDGYAASQGRYNLSVSCPFVVAAQGDVGCGSVITGNSATGVSQVGQPAPEHWWRFVAPTTGVYTFNSCGSSYDSWIHLFRRTGNNANGQLASCDDCGPCGTRTVLAITLQAGSYFVVMDGYSNSSGTYRLGVTCPGVPTIEGTLNCNSNITGNTATASHSVGQPAPEHHFALTVTSSQTYVFNSCGSAYDTWISIYNRRGTSNSGNILGNSVSSCDDCGPCGTRTVLTTQLTQGNYVVVLDGYGLHSGNYSLAVSCAPPPPPTVPRILSCSGANSTVNGSTTGGTSVVGQDAPEHFFWFTAPISGAYTFSTCGSAYDTWLHVFNSNSQGTRGTQIASCDDCGPCGTRSVVRVQLVGNRSYLVAVDGWGTSNGAYQLSATCPSISGSQGTAQCGQLVTGNSATGVVGIGHAAPDHYYAFRAPVTGTYSFNSCGSNYDTYVHVYTRTSTNRIGTEVSSCDDCGPCGTRTVLTTALQAGDYWIVIDGWRTSSGIYRLRISCPRSSYIQGQLGCNQTVMNTTALASHTFNGHPAPEHYYDFTAPVGGFYSFSTCGSSFDTFLFIYRAAPAGSTALLGSRVSFCDDCGPCGLRAVLRIRLAAGNYVVVMDGYGTNSGNYTLATTCPSGPAPPPAAEGTLTCQTAQTGNTTGGTSTAGSQAPDHWYIFNPAASGLYSFSTCGSGFDTHLHIFMRYANGTQGNQVASCDDCGPCGLRSVLQNVRLLASSSYWIIVDGYASSSGAYRLQATCPPQPPTNPPAPTAPPSNPTAPPSNPTQPPNQQTPTAPPSNPTAPPSNPTQPPNQQNPTAPPSNPTAPPSNPTAPPSNPTAPPSNPTAPPSNPTAPPSNPTAPPSNPTAPPSNPTPPPSNPTAPPSNPTAPPSNPTPPPSSPTPPPSPASASTSNGGGSNGSLVYIIIVLIIVAVLVIIAAIFIMKRGGSGGAAADPRESFQNPLYANASGDVTFADADVTADTDTDGYMDLPIANDPDGLYDETGYTDGAGETGGYMDTAPADEDEDF